MDILKCGKISQILWSKNFSTIWKPILSQTYHQNEFSQMTNRKTASTSKTAAAAGAAIGEVVVGTATSSIDSSGLSSMNHKIDHRFTLDTKSNSSHALLRVNSVTMEDEGLYKCDITYVQPTCPSITYVKLNTMGKCKMCEFFVTFQV